MDFMDFMDFQGPAQGDFDNVTQLNGAFLRLLCRQPARYGLPERQQQRLRDLTQRQANWLAATPFLLFTLQENDDDFWQRLLTSPSDVVVSEDLFAARTQDSQDMADLLVATVSFLCQLAARSPHAVRLISGAGNEWCERLRERTTYELMQSLRRGPLRIAARTTSANDSADIWSKLLRAGVHNDIKVRHSAHVAALQTFLASMPDAGQPEWRSAACRTQAPYLQVADQPSDGKAKDRPQNPDSHRKQ